MEVFSTKNVAIDSGANILLYGQAGVGKTTALASLPDPIILSAEAGMLSLKDKDVAFMKISTLDDVRDAYKWLKSSEEAKKYRSVAIDSLSELCDIAFKDCQDRVGNEVQKLYPELRNTVARLIRNFKKLSVHFVCTAREQIKELRTGKMAAPTVVGNKLADDLPHAFDLVLHYTIDASNCRVVHTDSSSGSVAKDRTGTLPATIVDSRNLFDYVLKTILGESNVR